MNLLAIETSCDETAAAGFRRLRTVGAGTFDFNAEASLALT